MNAAMEYRTAGDLALNHNGTNATIAPPPKPNLTCHAGEDGQMISHRSRYELFLAWIDVECSWGERRQNAVLDKRQRS